MGGSDPYRTRHLTLKVRRASIPSALTLAIADASVPRRKESSTLPPPPRVSSSSALFVVCVFPAHCGGGIAAGKVEREMGRAALDDRTTAVVIEAEGEGGMGDGAGSEEKRERRRLGPRVFGESPLGFGGYDVGAR